MVSTIIKISKIVFWMESTKGYATEKEIKACFSPIYINSTSSGSTDTSAPSAGQ